MPCYDSDPPDSEQAALHKKLQVTTRLACEYVRSLEINGLHVPTWAKEWWEEHKRVDKIREGLPTRRKKMSATIDGKPWSDHYAQKAWDDQRLLPTNRALFYVLLAILYAIKESHE